MKSTYFLYFFIFVILCTSRVQAQSASDSLFAEPDNYVEDAHLYGRPDSLRVNSRAFAEDVLSNLKNDDELQYKQPPTVAESLFTRLMRMLAEFLDSLVNGAITTDWGRIISYLIGIGLLIAGILMLLKVNAFKVFYGSPSTNVPHSVIDENIHEMDFEKLIAEAIAQNEYRRATRLVFLHALKLLSDQGLIQWELGKTNHDYLQEVSQDKIKPGLHQLNYFFEYAWYGNFDVTRDKFSKVQRLFDSWRKELR